MVTAIPRSFEYAVRDRSGKLISGRTEAPSQDAAVAKLRRQGYVPVSVKEAGVGLKREINFGFEPRVSLERPSGHGPAVRHYDR